ncbi:hypothetical protein KIPB_001527 [Kipferlia bialata]|uniref:F5/8 type C domain-containing protein n=1 Tax=Kipferlia bialata TaxID=797122 RepID=A0A9K3CQR8_9EUKA|nr:hypothetical protein KIPB_001527 [Kipferlia bialata]|eukprot:g1527.t1
MPENDGEIMRAEPTHLDNVGLMTNVPPEYDGSDPTAREQALAKKVEDLNSLVMSMAQANMRQQRINEQLQTQLQTVLSKLAAVEEAIPCGQVPQVQDARGQMVGGNVGGISTYTRVCFTGASAASDCLHKMEGWYPGRHIVQTVEDNAARVGFSSACYNDNRDFVNSFSLYHHADIVACWKALERKEGEYISFTFERPVALVGVATMGRQCCDHRTEKLAIETYVPETRQWVPVDKTCPIYDGNHDHTTAVLHALARPVVVKQMRVVVRQYRGHPAMRLEVFVWE